MGKISIINIWRWFSEQIGHPKTFFQRKTWGVFSPFAHFRRSDHRSKQAYRAKQQFVAQFVKY